MISGHFIDQGRIQDFQIEGAQKIMCTQRTSQARSAKFLTAGYRSRAHLAFAGHNLRRSELCDAGSNQPWRYRMQSSARCALQALSRMSDAAQPCIVVYMIVMHERIPSPGKVSDWLILQLRWTSRLGRLYYFAITVLDSKGIRMESSS